MSGRPINRSTAKGKGNMDGVRTPSEVFEIHRPALLRLAYRMTGSFAEAEDIVQDAWLRWSRVHGEGVGRSRPGEPIDRPLAWLRRTVTRLSIDHMRSARVRRERYVGPWLPEPVAAHVVPPPAPDELAERADEVTAALLLVLERLAPAERAAFLLHDVFGVPHREVAVTLGCTPAAARQTASRARRRVREARRGRADRDASERFTKAFHSVLASGDLAAFMRMLADDVALHVDAGGTKPSALRPLRGRDEVTAFLLHIASRALGAPSALEGVGEHGRDVGRAENAGRSVTARPGDERSPASRIADLFAPIPLSGETGYRVREPDGSVQVWTLDWNADGTLAVIHIQRNAGKLGAVTHGASAGRGKQSMDEHGWR